MLTYHYDNANRLDYVTDSAGGTRTYEFDNNNQLRARTFTDGTNDLRIEYDYNLRNQVEEIRRYSDLVGTTLVSKTNIVYLDNGLVDTITHRDGTNALIDDFNYDYDELNRVIQETSHLGPTRNHDYDPINQLLDDGTDSFTYDKNHNRTMAGYSTTTGNRLASDGIWNYGYDNEGNRTSQTKIIGGEVWLFTYNHNNQLTKAEHKASSVSAVDLSVEYGYDVFNNRISRAVDADGVGAGAAVVEKFAFEGSNAWADLDNAGSLTTRRVFGDSIDELIARIDSNGVAWYLTDRLNSVRDIVDSTGALINHIDYASYGERTQTQPANGDRYGFTGQEHDDVTGLMRFGERDYDVYNGGFVQQDPIGFAGGLNNLNNYVGNNPSNLTDPTGLQASVSGPSRPPVQFNSGVGGLPLTDQTPAPQQPRPNYVPATRPPSDFVGPPAPSPPPVRRGVMGPHRVPRPVIYDIAEEYSHYVGPYSPWVPGEPPLPEFDDRGFPLPAQWSLGGTNSWHRWNTESSSTFLLKLIPGVGTLVCIVEGDYVGAFLSLAGDFFVAIKVVRNARLARAVESQAQTLAHRNGIFEVLSEQSISGTARASHRSAANASLARQLQANAELNRALSEALGIDDVLAQMRSGTSSLRNPLGTEWHHPIENSGVMWLLRRPVHRHPQLQGILHPNGRGGFANNFGN